MKNEIMNIGLDLIGGFVTLQGAAMDKLSYKVDSQVLEVVIALNANSEQLWKDVRAIEGPRSQKFEQLFVEGTNKNGALLEANLDKAIVKDATSIARLVQKAATRVNFMAQVFIDELK